MEHCDECGFTYADHGPSTVAAEVHDLGPRFEVVLSDGPDGRRRLGTRPAPDVWSPVEYGCHVRDVLLAQRERLLLALVEEEPTCTPIYRDRRVDLAHYADEPPGEVASEIVMAARLVARVLGGLDDRQWERTCIYNFPEPCRRTMLWLAQHTLHEGTHHLMDTERGTPAGWR